jgi:type VI secretion system secreted protein Hcp
MAAAMNAFMKIGKAEGEARQGKYGREKWIELQSWDWKVEAETSWTKGGGASVGKPSPGEMTWEHYWDRSSHLILGYICTGTSFPTIHLEMCKGTGAAEPQPYFKITMEEAFITKVENKANEDGGVSQTVTMVFKTIKIEYSQQGVSKTAPGKLEAPVTYEWDIPGGKASPSTGA